MKNRDSEESVDFFKSCFPVDKKITIPITYELTVVNKTSKETVKLDSSDSDIAKHTLFRIKLDTFNFDYRAYGRPIYNFL